MEQWAKIELDSQIHIIKFVLQKQNYPAKPILSCWLSDFKALWTESIETKEILLERIGRQNPGVGFVGIEEKAITQVSSLPENNSQMITNNNIDSLELTIKYNPLKFIWILRKCDEQSFFDQITSFMLRQMFEQQQINNQLTKIITQKDNEIEQYKLNGAKPLQRSQYITKPFDSNESAVKFNSMFVSNIDAFSSLFASVIVDESSLGADNDAETREKSPANVSSSKTTSPPKTYRNKLRKNRLLPNRRAIDEVTYAGTDEDSSESSQNDNNKRDEDCNTGSLNASKSLQAKRRRALNL